MMASKALFTLVNSSFVLAFFLSATAISITLRKTGDEMTSSQVHDNTFNATRAQVHVNTGNTTWPQVHVNTGNTTWPQVHVNTGNTNDGVISKDLILEINAGLGLDLVEGDIIEDRLPESRTVIRDEDKIWANRTIPYIIELSVEPAVRQYIREAIEEFQRHTCLHWTPRTTQRDFIVFTAKTGCSSTIGKRGGPQELSLTTPCAGRGTAMHEMMHALGFFHEHSRPDRDQWVQILLENVEPGKESNFDREPEGVVDTLGVAYDYGSIMHYASTAFSANGLPTILPLRDAATVLGQRQGFSGGDLQRISLLYGCVTSVVSWSSWRDVNQCDVQCRQLRNRACLNPDPRVCRGYSQEFVSCPSPCRPALSLGCWANKPWNGSAVPSLEGLHPDVIGDFRSRPSAVRHCADIASSIGSLIFAVQRGGECLAGSGAELTFSLYGPSSECQPGGRGGASAMEVYTFTEELLIATSTSTTPTTSEATPLNVLPDLTTPLSTFFTSSTRDVPTASIGWSSWRSLTNCDRHCQQIRYRLCLSLDPRACQGHSLEILNCSSPCIPSRETTTSSSQSSMVTSYGTTPSGQSQQSSPSTTHSSHYSHLLTHSSTEFNHASFTHQTFPTVTQATPQFFATQDQSTNAAGQTGQSSPSATQATPHLTAAKDQSTTSSGQTVQSPPTATQATPRSSAALDQSTPAAGQTQQSFSQEPLVPSTLIGWGSWRNMTQCDVQCRQFRYRLCLNPDSRLCQGYRQEMVTCPAPCRPALSLGCWTSKPWNGSAVLSLEGLHPDVIGDFRSQPSAVRHCADVAGSNGSTIFAVQNGGLCLAGPLVGQNFSLFGPSSGCEPGGRGGPDAMEVYTLSEGVDGSWGLWTPWTLCSRCCGGGRKYRFRKCDSPPRFGQGVDCQGLHQQNTSCNRHRCQASLLCGRRLYTGDPGHSGFVHLPRYQNCMTCEYLVTSRRPSDTVSVRVTYLQLEQSEGCVYDALSIYDSSNPIPGRLLGTYCGRNHFPTLQSSGNALLVTFTSDSTIADLGFTIVYSINNSSRKACIQPAVPSSGNLTGSNFVGDTVIFSCRPGSHMRGQSTITCVDQPGMAVWSHGFPVCVAGTRTARDVTDETVYKCTFEGHLCGFRLDLGQTGRSWLLVKGNNSADLLKPAFDRFNSTDGHFMYVESKRVRLGGDVARMSTAPLDLSAGTDLHHCLTFWYRLRGDLRVQLEVSAMRSGRTRGSTVWISKGNNQDEWKKAKVELQTLGDILITFQALLGNARSSAAVDDVIISSGLCSRT